MTLISFLPQFNHQDRHSHVLLSQIHNVDNHHYPFQGLEGNIPLLICNYSLDFLGQNA